jgi:hypothetical protein
VAAFRGAAAPRFFFWCLCRGDSLFLIEMLHLVHGRSSRSTCKPRLGVHLHALVDCDLHCHISSRWGCISSALRRVCSRFFSQKGTRQQGTVLFKGHTAQALRTKKLEGVVSNLFHATGLLYWRLVKN